MIAGLIRGHPLGVFFIVCLLLVIVETGLLLTALTVNTIVNYCQLERLPAIQLEDPRFFQLPLSRLLVDVLKDPEVGLWEVTPFSCRITVLSEKWPTEMEASAL